MSVIVVKTDAEKKQLKIYNIIKNLQDLPKVTVIRNVTDFSYIKLQHQQEFVPDFEFIWCCVKEHYRVYILVGDRDHKKRSTGYSICTIGSAFAAMGFGTLYGFLHKHRANNKEEAYLNR